MRVFAPPQNPSFTVPIERDWDTTAQKATKPYVQTIPRQIRGVEAYELQWAVCDQRTRDYIVSFEHEMLGPVTPFFWTPNAKHWAPEANDPLLSHVSGGSLGSRSYYAKFTWYDPATDQETTPSPATFISVPSNRLLQVDIVVIPMRVPAARIYVGTAAGSEMRQGYITTRTWLEPVTGALSSAPLAPTANTLYPQKKWKFAGNHKERQIRSNRWEMSVRLVEYWL